MRVAVVAPVYGNEGTLRPLADRLAAALAGRDWSLRLVVDASPDDSAAVAAELTVDPRIAVTVLTANVGQHAALARGLADEADADAWVCLDADLQDPPAGEHGRRGAYESWLRRRTDGPIARKAPASAGRPVSRAASRRCRSPVRRRSQDS